MPANEQTWRKTKLLHVVFAVSSVIMLVSTLWMFAVDHHREWHDYQDTNRDIDLKMTHWRTLQEQSDQALAERERLTAQLTEIRSNPLPEAQMAEFRQILTRAGLHPDFARLDAREKRLREAAEVAAGRRRSANEALLKADELADKLDAARQAAKADQPPGNSAASNPTATKPQAAIDELTAQWRLAVAAAEQAAREKENAEAEVVPIREVVLDELKRYLREATFREDEALRRRKFENANLDAAKANLGIGVRDSLPESEMREKEAKVRRLEASVAQLNADYQQKSTVRRDLQKIIKRMTAAEEAAQVKLDGNTVELRRQESASKELRVTYFTGQFPFLGKRWLDLPILDAFNSPRKIDNLWSEGLDEPLGGFGRVRRFDRCTTCHRSIAKTAPNTSDAPAYAVGQLVTMDLPLPENWPDYKDPANDGNKSPPADVQKYLEDVFGVQFSADGLVEPNEVTVRFVRAKSPAARAVLVTDEGVVTRPTGAELRASAFEPQRLAIPGAIRIRRDQFPLPGAVSVVLSGLHGEAELTLAAGTTDESFVELVNNHSVTTGVRAYVAQGEIETVVLASQDSGPGAFVALAPRPGAENFVRSFSAPRSEGRSLEPPATLPGLVAGDVIIEVDGDAVAFQREPRAWVTNRWLDAAEENWERKRQSQSPRSPLRLTVRRGLPSPYCSHPRLDLYVGSLSPHKLETFACTVCHGGQGSATAFNWASHTPNDPPQQRQWTQDHGWFDNHHWTFPMYPRRFAESACIKCHHEVASLEPSNTYPDPPAPKVVHGYRLIEKNGCYGCHEILGFDGPLHRIGPDLRLEPNYYAAAAQLKGGPGTGLDEQGRAVVTAYARMTDEERGWVEQLIFHPERDAVRHELRDMLLHDKELAKAAAEAAAAGDKPEAAATAGRPRFSAYVHTNLLPLFNDVDTPGKLRKVGPSLRSVASKDDATFMFDWIRNPQHFRPSTRMPRFFGQWDHLNTASRQVSERFEPMEVLGMLVYLRVNSQPYAYAPKAADITPSSREEKIARGKILFQQRGCLACHTHHDFPDARRYFPEDEIVQGPDLSALGRKFNAQRNPNGAQWLYSWIKNPSQYAPRTLMPNLFLEPIQQKDALGNVVAVTDPIEDIVEYLLSDISGDWAPPAELPGESDMQAARDLALLHLEDAFFELKARDYLDRGIPESLRSELKPAETELLVPDAEYQDPAHHLSNQQLLRYLGRKTIGKYACYACHDVPGFEDAKPIGTGLLDWGRKEPERLAFEHILEYLEGNHAEGVEGPKRLPSDYFFGQLDEKSRIGFLHQKLLEPRSFDYHTTQFKKYNERLRMPRFNLNERDREAIMTFVLGLVADPPQAKYVYQPNEREAAIQEGQRVLEKYNCAGCHVLEPERWAIGYSEGKFGPQPSRPNYSFATAQASPEQLQAARQVDRRDQRHSMLAGMPTLSDDGRPRIYDQEDFPIEEAATDRYDPARVVYAFDLWKPTIVDGHMYQVGELPINVPANLREQRQSSMGGYLGKYLLPHVVAQEKRVNPNAKGAEAWGWLPPPLVGEGQKVQTEWLHDFLLDPHPIRPAVLLRMPGFNMSPDEASKLVNYFAAHDNAGFPYFFDPQRRSEHLAAADRTYADKLEQLAREGQIQLQGPPAGRHLDDAMKIVTNKNYCIKCHRVADFEPAGSDRAKAPDLSQVFRRLRTDYVRRWIAKPTGILPYTPMPVNIVFDPSAPFLGTTVPQDLYHGTSVEQVEALVDLLMNYDVYTQRRSLIAPLVQQAAPPAAAPAAAAAGAVSGRSSEPQ